MVDIRWALCHVPNGGAETTPNPLSAKSYEGMTTRSDTQEKRDDISSPMGKPFASNIAIITLVKPTTAPIDILQKVRWNDVMAHCRKTVHCCAIARAYVVFFVATVFW